MSIKVTAINGIGSATVSGNNVVMTGMKDKEIMHLANDFLAQPGIANYDSTAPEGNQLAVSQNGTPNMSVNVAPGVIYIKNSSWGGTTNILTKYWRVFNDATYNVAISANASGSPRIDIVQVTVTSTTPNSDASNVATINVKAGTPATIPIAPAVDSNSEIIATVYVANAASSITTTNITDVRRQALLLSNSDYATNANILINGNFDFWQRYPSGYGSATVETKAVADRWLINKISGGGTLPTITVSPVTPAAGSLPGSNKCLKINTSGAGTGLGTTSECFLEQKIENGVRLYGKAGQRITLSFIASSPVTNKRLGICAFYFFGTGGSPSSPFLIPGKAITLSSTFTKYSVTLTLPDTTGKSFGTNNDDFISIRLQNQWGSDSGLLSRFNTSTAEGYGTGDVLYLAQVQANLGSYALPFTPKPLNEELAACQRYYETGQVDYTGYATSGIQCGVTVHYKVTKRATPYITQTSVTNIGFPATTSSNHSSIGSFQSYRTCDLGSPGFCHFSETWTADAEV